MRSEMIHLVHHYPRGSTAPRPFDSQRQGFSTTSQRFQLKPQRKLLPPPEAPNDKMGR
jgi:hypothetical protein